MKQASFAQAAKVKYPEWVMFVTSIDPNGKPNTMPAGWCMFVSGQPRLVATAVGHARYTHGCIRHSKAFVLSWAGVGQEKLIEQTGSASGRAVDKFAEFGIATEAGVTGVPLIAGCAAHLECRLHSELDAGDHTIFVGEVVACWLPDEPVAKLDNFNGLYAVARPVAAK
jgi:flavin reductase (DIM6/NTAB) family NADH-FMN oxidoreductase RutF